MKSNENPINQTQETLISDYFSLRFKSIETVMTLIGYEVYPLALKLNPSLAKSVRPS